MMLSREGGLTRIDIRVSKILKYNLKRKASNIRNRRGLKGSSRRTIHALKIAERIIAKDALMDPTRIQLIANAGDRATSSEINMLSVALGYPRAFFYGVKEEVLDNTVKRWAKDLKPDKERDLVVEQELKELYLELLRDNPLH